MCSPCSVLVNIWWKVLLWKVLVFCSKVFCFLLRFIASAGVCVPFIVYCLFTALSCYLDEWFRLLSLPETIYPASYCFALIYCFSPYHIDMTSCHTNFISCLIRCYSFHGDVRFSQPSFVFSSFDRHTAASIVWVSSSSRWPIAHQPSPLSYARRGRPTQSLDRQLSSINRFVSWIAIT